MQAVVWGLEEGCILLQLFLPVFIKFPLCVIVLTIIKCYNKIVVLQTVYPYYLVYYFCVKQYATKKCEKSR